MGKQEPFSKNKSMPLNLGNWVGVGREGNEGNIFSLCCSGAALSVIFQNCLVILRYIVLLIRFIGYVLFLFFLLFLSHSHSCLIVTATVVPKVKLGGWLVVF